METKETKKFNNGSIDENLLNTYKKHKTVNYDEYEHILCAFLALKFSTSQYVSDFEMSAKDGSYPHFNDIALKVKFKDKTSKTFIFKVTHSGESKEDFFLINMLNCLEMDETNICILYTTESVKFLPQQNVTDKNETTFPEYLLNTGTVFRIDITQSRQNLHKQYYLLTNQNNLENMKYAVGEELIHMLNCEEIHHPYIEFMKVWWFGNFVLRKQDVIAKLAELALSPAVLEISDKKCNEKTKLLTDAIMKFEMTLVEDGEDIVENIWQSSVRVHDINLAALKYGFSNEETKNIDGLTLFKRTKVLWYLNKVPLIVKADKLRNVCIKSVIKLLEHCERKMKILLVGDVLRDVVFQWRVFENLSDLIAEEVYEDIIQNFRISLQGKPCFSLKQLMNVVRDTSTVVETRQLLKMSQEDLVIDSIEESLPSNYIPRSISASFFNTKKLLNNYELLKNDLVIIFNYDKKQCKKLIKLSNVEIVELSDYRWLIHPHNEDKRKKKTPLVVLADKCSDVQFDEICNATEKQNIYVVQIVDEDCCKLIMGKQNTNKSEEVYIEESKIHSFCQAPINALCSQPGMGKSTMMTFLAINCPSDVWTIRVNLKDHERFLKEKVTSEKVLPYFLNLDTNDGNSFTHRIKTSFLKSARICLFLDGLNEIDSSSVDFVLDYIKYISSTGIHVWLSSRKNLKEKIKTFLYVFPMDIKEVHTDQQKQYLQKRLGSKYESDKVEMILTKVELKVPLQLYMVSEVLLNDDRFYEKLNQEPVVLQIYKSFFSGKLKGQNHDLEQYEYAALAACLETNTLQKLGLDVAKCLQFFRTIRDGDNFGIISRLNDEDRPVFVHQTFAEYFAALWMSKNFDKVRLLGDEFFGSKYQVLRMMFDTILSEKCPLHLAIIYKNVNQIKKHLEYFHMKDKGGRNAIHLFCSYSMMSQEILDHLSDFDPAANDNVFEWNCLDYAIAADSLLSVELILKRFGNSVKLDHLYQRYDDNTLAFYFCKFGYPNLLSAIFRKNSNVSTFVNPNGSSLLHIAVDDEGIIFNDCPRRKTNTFEIIDSLIRNGTDVNIRDNKGATALHYASKFGLLDAVEKLLVHNTDIHTTTKAKETALHYSLLEEPNLDIVRLLIDAGIDVNAKDEDGNSALLLAAARGNRKIAKILIESGADAKAATYSGETILHVAVCNSIEVVELLLDEKVDINAKDQSGRNALHAAAENGNYKIVKLLIEKGGDVKALTCSNETLLHYVFKKEPNMDVVDILLKNRVDPNVTNSDGLTALHLAVVCGNHEVVKLLIEKNADIEATSNTNQTILHHAVLENADEDITKLLLDSGADINAKDRHGRSALHLAVEAGNYKMVRILIDKGASVNVMTNHSETILTYAIKKRPNLDIIALLLDKGADVNIRNEHGVTALHEAVSKNIYQIVKSLIEKGANINVVDHQNLNVLHYAASAEQPNLQIIKLLIKQDGNVNAKSDGGETALHLVAKSGSYDVIKALIEHGADIKALTSANKSVLHYALQSEPDVKIVKLLLDNGIDPNAKDIDEISVLHLAAYSGNYEIVKTLLQRGSDVKATTSSNKTILHYAFMGNTNMEVIKLLLECGVDVNETDEAGESALYLAAVHNNELLKVLIDKGGNVKTKTITNETVLHNLISNGDPTVETVELLINNGVDVVAEENNGLTALHFAVKFGYYEIVQILIGKNVNVKAVTQMNQSVLYYAVKHDANVDIIQLLLNNGANCEEKDEDGVTALHLAAERGSFDTLKLLIDNGANVKSITYTHQGVLHYAFKGEPDLEVVKLLLDSGCDVNTPDADGIVALHLAAENGNLELMEILLEKGANIEAVTHSNKTVLHYATEGKSIEVINLLLRRGIDIDAVNEHGESAVHLATKSGSYDLVKALVDQGAKLQSKTYKNKTVLHYLLEGEPNLKILQLLLNQDIDVNVQDIDGVSAVHLAVKSGSLEIVSLLIEKGADVMTRTHANETVLHYASANGKILELVLNRGLDLNVRNKDGATALHLAASGTSNDVLKMLVAKGADLRAVTYYNKTVLHYAVKRKPRIEFVKLLLRNGVDPNVQDAEGMTALHVAVNEGYYNVVELLLQNGANINISTYKYEPLLHRAIKRSNLDIIKLLLGKKCDLEARDRNGETALHLAVKKGNYEVVKLLLECGADIKTILHYAVKKKLYLGVIKLLLDRDIDPSIQDEYGITPLHRSVEAGNLEILKALIDKGANLKSTTNTKATVLHYAINGSSYVDIVEMLLDNGLDINAKDEDGVSALHLAAENGNFAIAKLLIERGADVNSVTDLNDTVLHYALKKSEPNKEIIKLLLDKGININAKNYNEATSLHLAAEKGNYKILKMLLDKGGDIKAITDSRETILHYALKEKPNVDIVKLLLDGNIDIKRENYDGVTALHLAAQVGNYDIVKMLIEKGADLMALTDSKESVLHYAFKEKPDVDIVKLLLDCNVDIRKRDYDGVTALHLAVQVGNCTIAKMLIDRGADLTTLTDSNESILHYVFKNKIINTDVFMLLMDNDVSLNEKDEEGITPLHLAVETQNYEIVKILIDKGAVVSESVLLHVLESEPNFEILKLLSSSDIDLNWKNDEEQTVLSLAIEKGNYDIVKYLIEKGVDLTTVNSSNRSILHYAFCECRNVRIIELLLSHKIDVNAVDDQERTPLHEATRHGTYQMVEMMVEKSACVKAKTKKNQTLLNYIYDDETTVEPPLEVVMFLIDKGVDLNVSDDNGVSVLHNAAANGHYNVAKILIEKGADVQAVTNQNDTILNYACQFKEFDVAVAKLLIDSGVNVNMTNLVGKSPLENAFVKERYDVIKLLRRYGAICNKKEVNEAIGLLVYNAATDDDTLTSFFFWAAENKYDNLMEFAINKGAPIGLYAIAKTTELNWSLVRRLLDSGADVSAKDSNGVTALHWACKYSHNDFVKLLLDKGADINASSKTKETPLHYAMRGWDTLGTRWIVLQLSSKDNLDINCKDRNGLTPLHLAALVRNLCVVETLIDCNADVEAITNNKETVLHFAVKAWRHNSDLIEELLRNEKVNVNAVDANGVSALHLAAAKGDSEVVEMLLEHGAKLEVANNKKRTALHYVAEKWIKSGNALFEGKKICQNSPAVLELLFNHGIDVNATDEDGVSSLHLAVDQGHCDLVEKLIENGADVNAVTNKGQTVLDVAVNSDNFNKNVVKLLIQNGVEKNASALQLAVEKGYEITCN